MTFPKTLQSGSEGSAPQRSEGLQNLDGKSLGCKYSQEYWPLLITYLLPARFSSVAQSCLTLCNPMDRSIPGFPVHHQLLKLIQTPVHWVGDAIQPSHPLLSPSPLLPSVIPSIKVFSSVLALCIRWPNYWSFSFSIGPSNEYSGLIAFRVDWFDLLAVQGTLKSLLQPHSSKASIPWHSVFFMVQLSNSYMTAGKTIALTIWTNSLNLLWTKDQSVSSCHWFLLTFRAMLLNPSPCSYFCTK